MSNLAVFVHLDGSHEPVWVDPYAWVDPFYEAEIYALKWAVVQERYDRDTREMRERHAQEIEYMRAQLEAIQRTAADILAMQNPPPIIVKVR